MQALDKLDRQILRSLSLSAALRREQRLEETGVVVHGVALVKLEPVRLGLTTGITVRIEKKVENHKCSPMDLFRASSARLPAPLRDRPGKVHRDRPQQKIRHLKLLQCNIFKSVVLPRNAMYYIAGCAYWY